MNFGVSKFAKMTGNEVEMHNMFTEAVMLLRMAHPNIIRVRDVFKSKGELGTTFDYIEGGNLGTLIKEKGPLPEADCLKFFV